MTKVKSGIIFLLIFLLNGAVRADHRQHLFEQGNQAYQKKDYAGAVKYYGEILQTGYENADLYYNLGNSYYKMGQIAKAILNYEKALRLRPNDEDIRFNLQIANLSVMDKIPRLPELFYVTYFNRFRSLFSLRALTIITLLLYFLFFTFLIFWRLAKKRKLRLLSRAVSLSLLLLLVVFSYTFVSKIRYLQRNVDAIVMSPQVDVRSAPSEDGTEIFTIHEGLKVKITNTSGGWYEIRLPDGKEGWLQVKDVEVI